MTHCDVCKEISCGQAPDGNQEVQLLRASRYRKQEVMVLQEVIWEKQEPSHRADLYILYKYV